MEQTLTPAPAAPIVRFDRDLLNPLAGGTTPRYRFSVHGPDGRQIASEADVLSALASPNDAAARGRAIAHLNRVGAAFTAGLVRLSSAGSFPSMQTNGIPVAAAFSDGNRRTADTRWAALFQVRDMRRATSPVFKITDTYSAVEFKVYLGGERIEVRHVEGSQELYEAEIVAGGVQWNEFWSEWQDFVDVQEIVASMYLRYADRMAEAAYDVITASGSLSQTYDATGANTLEKDINTINAAIAKVRTELYGVTTTGAGTTKEEIGDAAFYLLYNPLTAGYESRITKALRATLESPNGNQSVGFVNSPVVPLGSVHVPTGAWYLVLPGRKLVAAIFRDLTLYDLNDPRIAGVAAGRIGQGAYKMVRGDSRQVVALALS